MTDNNLERLDEWLAAFPEQEMRYSAVSDDDYPEDTICTQCGSDLTVDPNTDEVYCQPCADEALLEQALESRAAMNEERGEAWLNTI